MQAGSDIEHITRLIAAKGYRMPESMLYRRLVHLHDESKGQELMIIYAEDPAFNRLTSTKSQHATLQGVWPELTDDLVAAARKNITIEQGHP
jgi:hypothetical protein